MERFWEIKGLKDYLQYLNFEEKVWSKENECFIDIKKKKLNMFYNNFMLLMRK